MYTYSYNDLRQDMKVHSLSLSGNGNESHFVGSQFPMQLDA